MICLRLTLLLAALALSALAADISGTWKAVFTCPIGEQPKTVSHMIFDLTADGTKLNGSAQIGSWPGTGEIVDGKIEGDRFSFTFVGKSPWKAGSWQGEASGLPRLTFTGTVQGKEMQVHVVWDSIMLYGTSAGGRDYDMKGKKTSD